jgi:hypothetical protein
MLVGIVLAIAMGVGGFDVVGSHPDGASAAGADTTTSSTEGPTTSTSSVTTSTSQPPTVTASTTTTTTLPAPRVAAETLENPFALQAPASPGDTTFDVQPHVDESTTTTTTTAPTTTTLPPGHFARTSDRIVITGAVLPSPEPILGAAGSFSRDYRTAGGLDGNVAVRGTETVDYTTLTFAQLSGRGHFRGTLRTMGDVALTFETSIPRSTSFDGKQRATESGPVEGLKGWKGHIALHYVVSESGNSAGTYRAVFTRARR